jgi:hypothetical protein
MRREHAIDPVVPVRDTQPTALLKRVQQQVLDQDAFQQR